jgi:hypothetical protein
MLETASKGGGIAKGYLRGTKEGVRFASAAYQGSHGRTVMDTLTKLILTPLVGAAIPLVTGYIRLLSRFTGACDG